MRCYRRRTLRRPPAQSWRTFLANHRPQLWAADFFTVQTLTFKTPRTGGTTMTRIRRPGFPVLLAALALCGLVLALSRAGAPPVGAQQGSIPARPTGLTVTAVTHDSVSLGWHDPGDASITHYQVLRRDRDVHAAGEFVTIKVSRSTVFLDT